MFQDQPFISGFCELLALPCCLHSCLNVLPMPLLYVPENRDYDGGGTL